MAQMYKVYIGDSALYFTQLNDINPNWKKMEAVIDWKSWVEEKMMSRDNSEWVVELGEGDANWHSFCDSFKRISAAGGRVHNERDEVLMIFRREKWDLPKGKVDKGESIHQAAVREVMEECGLKNVERGEKLGIIYHMYFHKEKWVLKDTHWFKMFSSSQEILVPQIEEDITAIEWVEPLFHEWKTNTFPSIVDVMGW
jgi:8-oxo-dGTP pyrophosphatase MutT (NUDIX family)